MSKNKAKKRMALAVERRISKQKPRKSKACIEVEVGRPRRTKSFGTSLGLELTQARRNKHA